MSLAFLFPGQGSQAVGMGQSLIEAFSVAREVFQEVDDALGQKLSALMKDGPEDQLTLTENAQPALMAVSVAVARVLDRDFGVSMDRASFAAGHSLGQYSALCAAGAISLSDTARLLKLRGQAMQRAVPVGEGAMASLIGPKSDLALAETAAKAGSAATSSGYFAAAAGCAAPSAWIAGVAGLSAGVATAATGWRSCATSSRNIHHAAPPTATTPTTAQGHTALRFCITCTLIACDGVTLFIPPGSPAVQASCINAASAATSGRSRPPAPRKQRSPAR